MSWRMVDQRISGLHMLGTFCQNVACIHREPNKVARVKPLPLSQYVSFNSQWLIIG